MNPWLMQGIGSAAAKPGSAAAPPPAPILDVDGVTLQYKTKEHLITATYRVGFRVYPSDRFVLLGPSGCGKSTLLKGVAGYLHPVEGEMRLKGRTISDPGPDRVMVFQEFDQLLPWKTVKQNITFALVERRPVLHWRTSRRHRAALHPQGEARPVRGHLPPHALRRHEAAGGDRPRHGDGA